MPRAARRLVPTLLVALLLATNPACAGTFSQIGNQRVQVAHVIDGDTFVTRSGTRVRLLGINTPEIEHDTQATEPLGYAAKRRLRQLIEGQIVILKSDRDKHDGYGRLLAQVYKRDGSWINGQLLSEGLAHVYLFAPNYHWAEELLKAERSAMRQRIGIWAIPRFRVLQANEAGSRQLGQYRVIEGQISRASPWRFQLASLAVTVPRNYRKYFDHPPALHEGMRVRIRGVLRTSRKGTLYLALHGPFDIEIVPKIVPQG